MNRKFFVSLAIILFTIFSFSICFASDGTSGLGTAANDVRNFVGGVESTVENAAMDVSNVAKDATGGTVNAMDGKSSSGMFTSRTNNNYTSTRTSTDAIVGGMSQNTWIWLIMGIAAIAIIAVVWYYSMQFTGTNRNNHNNDDE